MKRASHPGPSSVSVQAPWGEDGSEGLRETSMVPVAPKMGLFARHETISW